MALGHFYIQLHSQQVQQYFLALKLVSGAKISVNF